MPTNLIKIFLFYLGKIGRSIPTNLGHRPLQINLESSQICHPDEEGFSTLVDIGQLGHRRCISRMKKVKFLSSLDSKADGTRGASCGITKTPKGNSFSGHVIINRHQLLLHPSQDITEISTNHQIAECTELFIRRMIDETFFAEHSFLICEVT